MTEPSTGFLTHDLFFWYDHGPSALFRRLGQVEPYPHVESPEAKRRLRGLLEVSGLTSRLHPLTARPASDEELLRVHSARLIDTVRRVSETDGADVGEGAWVPRGGDTILRLAAGGAITAAEAVASGEVRNAYALLRPAGHHAEPDKAMGFCVFANTAVAIRHMQRVHGARRIVLIDWDVHHGNGAETIFWTDPDVLTISIHQDGLYPMGRGRFEDRGEGAGEGRNINLPLPAGSGHGAYVEAAQRLFAPAIRAFRPDMVFVSSGYDASVFDPLGRMLAHRETYAEMIGAVMEAAEEVCGGRVVVVHEGGIPPSMPPTARRP